MVEDHPALMELAVKASVSRVLAENPQWVNGAYDISESALILVNSSTETTLALLEEHVIKEIPWTEITPEEEILLRVLITAIKQEISNYLEKRGIDLNEERVVYIAQVMLWVNQTAEMYRMRAT
jgi:hypothetical protein